MDSEYVFHHGIIGTYGSFLLKCLVGTKSDSATLDEGNRFMTRLIVF